MMQEDEELSLYNELKQETVEEASFRFYPEDEQWTDRHVFKLGANWQAERMYSEEEVFELCKQFAIFIQQKKPSYKKQLKWFEQFKKK